MNCIKGTEGDDVLKGTQWQWWNISDYFYPEGNDIIYGLGGNDYIDGRFGDDLLFGGTGNDTLKGGSGNDVLKGEEGDDLLNGESGNDLLRGGEGNDLFVFKKHSGKDTILDFEQGHDRIEITHSFYHTVDEVLACVIYSNDTEGTTAYVPLGMRSSVEILGLHGPLTVDDFIIN